MLGSRQFLGLPAAKPRVWVDLSCAASKRMGLGMHAPGRWVLRMLVASLRAFAFLPIEKFIPGKLATGGEIEAAHILDKVYGERMRYATIYTGNDSAKSKVTALVAVRDKSPTLGKCRIVKLAKSKAAAEAIEQENQSLEKLSHTSLCDRVPVVGASGTCDGWTWCEQSVLPKGRKIMSYAKVYRDFQDELHRETREGDNVMVHGDFAPWNCVVVGGRLCVYDWEDAHMGAPDEDEKWFRKQLWELMGIKA